jgi:hypothetical protein
MMSNRAGLLALSLGSCVFAEQIIYSGTLGALAPGWENWSWNTNFTWASTSGPDAVPALAVSSDAYAALSFYDESNFGSFAGLRFDVSGANPDITITIQATGDNAQSPSFPLSALSKNVNANSWTTVTINFASLPVTGTVLPNDSWNRIALQAGGSGAAVGVCSRLGVLRSANDVLSTTSITYYSSTRSS